MKKACYLVMALVLAGAPQDAAYRVFGSPAGAVASGEVVVERWAVDQKGPHPQTIRIADGPGGPTIRVDLKDLPTGAKVFQARLLASRPPLTGKDEEARTDIEIVPKGQVSPLRLIGPWFDSFDATETVRGSAGGTLELAVRVFPKWQPERTELEVTFDRGKRPRDGLRFGSLQAAAAAERALNVRAVHRAGQTFITWQELDRPFSDKPVTLKELREARDALEKGKPTRYRVYRHDRPIDADNLGQAEFLAEVEPFSGFNWRGASLDRLIYQHQLRAVEDAAFARSIARGPFGGYHQNMPEMGQVVIDRLAIEDGDPQPGGAGMRLHALSKPGKPLSPGTGLYMHAPDKAGKAYYAVVPMVDGLAVPGGKGWATAEATDERVFGGLPVFQGVEDLKVFYDYPGERRRYVQWCSPTAGTANLPNQYTNWGVYVPPAGGTETGFRASGNAVSVPPVKLALAVYFHDARHLYMRPRWPHRADMITVSAHDDPPTFGYGYHESLGTLRSFAAGCVRDYTARRIDRFLDYVDSIWQIDPARLSTHGMGALGGTAALHYGLRRANDVSLIVAGTYDPDPQQTPPTCKVDNYPVRNTHLEAMEGVWGRKEWDLKTAEGKSIWDDRNLVAWVKANPKVNLPFLSLGSGSMHFTWPQENAFLKALLATGQPFWTGFTWGGEAPRFAPLYVRRDRLYLAASPTEADLAKTPFGQHVRWTKGALGYWSGGEINTGLGWSMDDIVDTPDRLEVTITGSGGRIALRNAQRFKLAPGEKARWEQGSGRDAISGEAAADANGLLILNGLKRGRLIVTRGEAQK